MSGKQKIAEFKAAGFSDEEIGEWAVGKRRELGDAGFSQGEIDTWFGQPPFDEAPLAAAIEDNKKRWESAGEIDFGAAKTGEPPAPKDPTKPPKPVTDFTEAIEAGFQISVSGLLARGEAPDKTLAADAPMTSRIAGQVATLAGDFPAMVGGFIAGTSGGAATGPGAPVVGMAGAFTLPTVLRETLMDAYTKGNFETFGDFWERASGILINTAKSWITGATTGAVGKVVGGAMPSASPVVRAGTVTASEIATMVTVGSALEGHVPNAQEFVDAAIIIGGAKGAGKLVGKLRDVYAKTGVRPADVLADIERDVTVAQDLLAGVTPKTYGGAGNPPPPPPAAAPVAPPPPPPGSVAAAQATILSKINVGSHDNKPAFTWSDFYRRVVDDISPIREVVKEMTGGKIPAAEQDPYQLARLTRGTFGKADQFLERSTYDFKTYADTGAGLKAVLEPVRNDLDGWRAYAVSKRAIELEGRGINPGVDMAAARQVVAAGRATYEPVMRATVEYQNRLVKYLKDAGVLSDEAFTAMKAANKDYVPFYRMMDEGAGGQSVGKGSTTRNPIKGIKGSDRDIVDPLESIIKNTYVYIALAERNAVGKAFVDLANASGRPQDFIEKVRQPTKPTTVTDKEMSDFLAAHGIANAPADLLTVFRSTKIPPGPREIAVFEAGKRTVYEVDADVALAFKGVDAGTANLLVRVLAVPAKMLRAGSVLSPDFISRNAVRDLLSAMVNTKGAVFSPIDTVKGFVGLARKDADFENWLKAGGANAALVALDRQYLQNNLFKLSGDTGLMSKAWNVAKSPLDILRATSELIENATRLGEFKKVAGGATDKATLQEAGFASREVTVDFARIGANIRALNMISAFANAQIQGLDRTIRQFGDAPAATSLRVAAFITAPSVLLWLANHDDPRWKDIPRWQKDLFWIVMGKDNIYRIPKPHELGVIFGSLPERILEHYVADNPDAFRDFGNMLVDIVGMNVTPTVATPIMDQFANRSTFSGAPLIPAHVEKLLPEYQYTEYSTEAAKALGKLIGAFPGIRDQSTRDEGTVAGGVARALSTPILLENYLRGWTGGLGRYALQLGDKILRESGVLPDPVKAASTLADIPVVKAFVVRYPSASSQQVQDFYEDYFAKKRVWDTFMAKAKEGDAAAAERVAKIDPSAFAQFDDIREALTTHGQLIRMINKDPGMTANDKRQLIDTLYFRMIELAEAGNEALKATEKAFGK